MMAHLCSRYLEKKLIKLQRTDARSGYRSEDEVYGFLPSPFKRKNKRQLQDPKRRSVYQNKARNGLNEDSASLNDVSPTSHISTSGLRDVTNKYDQKQSRGTKTKSGSKDLIGHSKMTLCVPGLPQSELSSESYARPTLQTDNGLVKSRHGGVSSCDSAPPSIKRNNQSSRSNSCQSLGDTGESSDCGLKYTELSETDRRQSVQNHTSDSLNSTRQLKSTNSVVMETMKCSGTIQHVDACLLNSTLSKPANIVMFVVKRHFLRTDSGEILQHKILIGMLVNALFSTKDSGIFVKLPNGQAGFVPKDTLKPLGVKNVRNFTQQFPENCTLDSPEIPEAIPSFPKRVQATFVDTSVAEKYDESVDDESAGSSSFSEGTFVNSLFYSDNGSFWLAHSDDAPHGTVLKCDTSESNTSTKDSGLQHVGLHSETSDSDQTTNSSTDRQSLLDYLKLFGSNALEVPTNEPNSGNTPLLETNDKLLNSKENSNNVIRDCVTEHEYEPVIDTRRENSIRTQSDGGSEINEKMRDPCEISRISLRDITFRPPLDNQLDMYNTYENLPDMALLMQRCNIKNAKYNDKNQSNDSGISQTSVTSLESVACESVVALPSARLLQSTHERVESADTSVIPRCGSYRDLCQSTDCAMCCPCRSCGFEQGSSVTQSSSAPCIDDLSSIHAASSTTSDLTLVTSPDSVTSAFTSQNCSFVDSNTPKNAKSDSSADKYRKKSRKLPKSSSKCDNSLNTGIDLLKTIESIETTDSGNWSEVSSDCEDITEGKKQPRLTALFDYVKKSIYDVNLRKQEVVTLIDEQNSDWLWVRNEKGEVGYIPRNYVVNLEKLNLDPYTKTTYL